MKNIIIKGPEKPEKEKLAKTSDAQQQPKLVCFDFDSTLTAEMTAGKAKTKFFLEATKLPNAELFAQIVDLAAKSNNQYFIAITSHSDHNLQPNDAKLMGKNSIQHVLKVVVPKKYGVTPNMNAIILESFLPSQDQLRQNMSSKAEEMGVSEEEAWKKAGANDIDEVAKLNLDDSTGKNIHIKRVLETIKEQHGLEIDASNITLVDDDYNNILRAKEKGYQTIHVLDADGPEVTGFMNTLKSEIENVVSLDMSLSKPKP